MIIPLSVALAVDIATRMRESDCIEVFATSDLDARTWGRTIADVSTTAYAVTNRIGQGQAMGGGLVSPAHTANMWFVGTDAMDDLDVRIACHRMIMRCHRTLQRNGVKRFQVFAIEGNVAGRQWLDRLGYRHEGTHPGFGRDGQTFLSFGKVA